MRDLQTKASFVHGECTASRDTASSFFKRRLIAGTGGLAVMRTSGLQLGLAPPKQLGNRIDAIGDVPSVAQIELCLVQPADVTRPHLRLQTLPGLRQDALLRATSLRGRQQRRQAAFAIALPPTLSRSHTIAQHLRRLADARDTLFLEKPKQPQAIGSGLVTSRFLRSLQPGDIFLDQQRVSDVHTQPPVQSRPPILNRANKPALLLIPILPIFSLCRTSRFIRIGMIHRLVTVTEEQRAAVALVRHLIWWFYRDLKLYRTDPSTRTRASLKARFDRLFTRTTGFAELDKLLARLKLRKAELLVTLERPEVPLNTNSSEQDVRDPVTIRKISGSTRGEDGRRCRDTFLSLKKTCQKNAISFWAFLGDRLGITVHGIAHLPDLIRQRAAPKPV